MSNHQQELITLKGFKFLDEDVFGKLFVESKPPTYKEMQENKSSLSIAIIDAEMRNWWY